MRILDLFAGIGGFSLAAHWMGWQTAAFIEKEPFCQKVLAKNFPGVPIYGDIFEFDGTPFRGTTDIVCGGFPCQPFSTAGKRKGRGDERAIFPQMLRVVDETHPRWVVAENVRGLLSSESGHAFEDVAASLEGIGYEVVTFCIPACAVNAKHRRERIWIIAQPRSFGRDHGSDHWRGGYVQADSGLTTQGQPERQGWQRWTSQAGATDTNAHQPRSQGRDGQELRERAEQWTSRPRSPFTSNATIRGLPDWAKGTVGQPSPVTEFERSDGSLARRPGRDGKESEREIERDFRGVAYGVSARVDRLKALGNSIVPQIALEIFRAIDAAERTGNS